MTFTGTQSSATDMDPSDDQSHEVLAGLREDFPCFRIWRERTCDRIRYVARSLHPGLNPHTVVTDDLDELRAALEPSRHAACARPHAAGHIIVGRPPNGRHRLLRAAGESSAGA
jgi:hypothetical protein